MDHINLNLGNVLFIGSVAVLSVAATLAVVHWTSHRDIPILSPTARGAVDFVAFTTNNGRTTAAAA